MPIPQSLVHLLEAEDALPEAAQWRPLLSIGCSEEAYQARFDGAEVTAARTIQFMTRERTNPNGIRTSLRLARENARVVRDRISNEMWEAINEMWLRIDRLILRRRPQPCPWSPTTPACSSPTSRSAVGCRPAP